MTVIVISTYRVRRCQRRLARKYARHCLKQHRPFNSMATFWGFGWRIGTLPDGTVVYTLHSGRLFRSGRDLRPWRTPLYLSDLVLDKPSL